VGGGSLKLKRNASGGYSLVVNTPDVSAFQECETYGRRGPGRPPTRPQLHSADVSIGSGVDGADMDRPRGPQRFSSVFEAFLNDIDCVAERPQSQASNLGSILSQKSPAHLLGSLQQGDVGRLAAPSQSPAVLNIK